MELDFSQLTAAQRYKLLVGLVVPRPIALVSTLGQNGIVNAAPFSFFNILGDDPPILIISIENKPDGQQKDTTRNILDNQEFVVNLVDEALAGAMHGCSTAYPSGISELEEVGLTTLPSRGVAPPRIKEAPVALECKLYQHIQIHEKRHLFIGEVLWLHTADGIIDPETLRIRLDDSGGYFPIGRLYADRYTTVRDQFTLAGGEAYVNAIKAMGRS